MGLLGRPRDYTADRPATSAERAVRFQQHRKARRDAEAQQQREAEERQRKYGNVTPRTKRRRVAKAALDARATGEQSIVTPTVTLLCKAIEDLTDDDLAPRSLDAIITDPPYGREFLPLYEALGRFAVRYLKPGGTLATQHGDVTLDEVLVRLRAHLPFQAQLIWHLQGAQTYSSMHTGYSYFTKSVLVFGKPPWKPVHYNQSNYWSLPQTSDRTAFHGWGQASAGIAEIFKRITTPGMRVCDPFMGGGTSAVVAIDAGCAFLGIDHDLEGYEPKFGCPKKFPL
jgi:site-specific DNA-methyltransferase (adenine-specific)